jgi:proline iminopeptidase
MHKLFPEINPYKIHSLRVSTTHTLYIEEVGNPNGEPILILHGGPGSGVTETRRRFFDPTHYRIILFDQRGAGKSTPQGSLEENTTWHLVEDIEKIRLFLNVDKWIVFGSSWGSTLGLAYTQMHSEKVSALIISGIFLCRKRELKWFYQDGCDLIFPDYWQNYINPIPIGERNDMIAAYHKRLNSKDLAECEKVADSWNRWEGSTLELIHSQKAVQSVTDKRISLSRARIENHYFFNGAFLKSDNFLLENASKLANVPGTIIHGRYDVVCPLINAWELSKAWTKASFEMIENAGHSAYEPGITDALIRATEHFKGMTFK